MDTIISELHDAKEYGSILTVTQQDWSALYDRFAEITEDINMFRDTVLRELLPLVQVAEALAHKYDVVVTNPPYMASNGMSDILLSYIKKHYGETKQDLYAVFIDKCINLGTQYAKIGLMTSYTWMFLSSFENARKKWLEKNSIHSLIQPEYHAFFESAYVPICTFVFLKNFYNYTGTYMSLSRFYGAEIQSIKVLEAISDKACQYVYRINTNNIKEIPGAILAYGVSDKLLKAFKEAPSLASISEPKQGLITGDNNRFLRLWFEVSANNVAFVHSKKKWYPFNKGGEFRRWYGNREYILLWENDGQEIKNFKDTKGKLKSRPQNLEYNFKPALSWSLITSGEFSVRYYDENFAFNVAGISCFPEKHILKYLCGILNSKVVGKITKMLNPTLNMNVGDVAKVPIWFIEKEKSNVEEYVDSSIAISKKD